MKCLIKYIHILFGSRYILKLFQVISGTKIYKSIPYGLDFFNDVNQHLDNYNFEVIFDVVPILVNLLNILEKRKKIQKFYHLNLLNKLSINLRKMSKKKILNALILLLVQKMKILKQTMI